MFEIEPVTLALLRIIARTGSKPLSDAEESLEMDKDGAQRGYQIGFQTAPIAGPARPKQAAWHPCGSFISDIRPAFLLHILYAPTTESYGKLSKRGLEKSLPS